MTKSVFRGIRRTIISALFVGVFVVVAVRFAPLAHATAGINQQINFQGRLLNAQGAVVADGYYNMQFKIYQDGAGTSAGNPGGTLKWTENWLVSASQSVQVKNGYMSVQLGANSPLSSVDWNQNTLWLSINVGNTSSCSIVTSFTTDCGGDGEMLPMKRLGSTAYAMNAGTLGGKTVTDFIQNQNSAVQPATNFWVGGVGRADTALQAPLLDTATATALNIGTTNATAINLNQDILVAANKSLTYAAGTGNFDQSLSTGTFKTGQGAVSLNGDVTVAANKSLTVTGGSTASRPASPTEGMLFYDTSVKQMLTYANGKWQGDRSAVTKVVAASNASQTIKDSADYVATGADDQNIINTALTAAAGGKVYLSEGVFTTRDSINVPNDTTLAGAGRGSLIKFGNIVGQNKKMITNFDTTTPTGITVRDLQLDGNRTVNTSGTQTGVQFIANTSAGSGSTARQGMNVQDTWVNNFIGIGIWYYDNASYGQITNNVVQNNGSDGIMLWNNSYNVVTNNTLQGNGGKGIDLTGSTYSLLSTNTVNGNATGGIILFNASNFNTVSGNGLNDNGGVGGNHSIYISLSSSNIVINNMITDTAGTGRAINIADAGSINNYLGANTYSGTGATTINNVGVGTIFGGQLSGIPGTGAYTVQNAGNIDLVSGAASSTGSISLTTGNASAGNSGGISLDVGTATGTKGTISIGTTNASNLTLGNASSATTIQGNTGVTLNATTGTTMVCRNGTGYLSVCDATYLAPTATNFIQNQSAIAQTGNYWVSGTARADTSVLTPVVDTAAGTLLNIGTTNAVAMTIGRAAISTTIASSSIVLGTSNNTTNISAAAQLNPNAAGTQMIIRGSAGNGAGNGGDVTLQGGNSGATSGNGGNLILSGGTGVSGTNGLVVLTTATMQQINDANCYNVASSCSITSASLNGNSAVVVGFTSDGQTATLPNPPLSTAGRLVYITASGTSKDFTLSVNGGGSGNQIAMRKNTTATMIWNGSAWTAAGASSSTTLQAAYDNTLQSAGGAELVVSKTSATNGLTVRDSIGANAVNGALLSVQTGSASNLMTINSNVTEYTSNSGAETYSGVATTFPASTWVALTGSTVTRNVTTANIATGQGSAQVVTSTTAGSGIKNVLSTSLTAGQHYNVSFAAKLSSGTFTDLAVSYSVDGAADTVPCTANQAVKTSVWTKVNCTITAPSSGITASNSINIRQAAGGTARTFFVDNVSVTIAADYNYSSDGNVNDSPNFATNWTAVGTSTVTRYTLDGQEASDSAQAAAGTTAGNGVKNKLSINPLASTLYRVSVYAKLASGTAFTDFKVRYTPDNGSTFVDCVDYNTQTVNTTDWTQVTCYINTAGTAVSNPYVQFVQPTAPGSARTYLVDAFSMTLASNSTPNVQVGGGSNGGPTTLFTVDKGASAPIAANNDALLGSMYYDTTLGKLQCYEADGWGACGSSPDNIVTISPEYTNAVMHGTGVGTMVSDFCSSAAGININDGTSGQPTICGANETYNFYRWTSPQPTSQSYSIYVTYQLPNTFKSFASGATSIKGRTDSNNSTVSYTIYRSNPATGMTPCGSSITVSTGVKASWQPGLATGSADPSTCGFIPGDSIVFKIIAAANSNANAYIGNLGFTFSNR